MLSTPEIGLVALTLLTLAIILWNKLPVELVALMLLSALGLSGLVSTDRLLAGFSSPVAITLVGLFVITKALEETGVVHRIAERLNRVAGGSEVRLVPLFMVTGATMSLVMNNIAAGAVLLPAGVRVAQIANVKVSKLLIPISFGTLVGGMATYFTTANIVMSSLLIDNGFAGLTMTDFLPVGGLIAVVTIGYMSLVGRHLLPERESVAQTQIPANLQETYQLEERTWEVSVDPDSPLVGSPLARSGIGHELGLSVLAIWRGSHAIFSPGPEHVLRANDYLLVLGRKERLDALLEWGTRLRQGPDAAARRRHYHVHLTEVIIPPRSEAIGKTLMELKFRKQFGVTAVAIWREGRSYRTDVGTMELRVGDALLVVGYAERIQDLAADRNYLVPITGYYSEPLRPDKAPVAVAITLIVIALAILNLVPLAQVALAGSVAMVLTGCLRMDDFYRAIEWNVIFLIAGMWPLSIAIIDTGLADRVGSGLVTLLSGYDSIYMIVGMFLLAALTTQVIGGQISALLVGPIAITAALRLGVKLEPMAVAVAIGCSTAFLTPIAHPVNVLMMGPAGYRFNDFFRVGIGMTLITLATLVLGMIVFWRLW